MLICGDGGGDAVGTAGQGRAELAAGVVWGPTTRCFQKEMDSYVVGALTTKMWGEGGRCQKTLCAAQA
jgi:hypothetical protein